MHPRNCGNVHSLTPLAALKEAVDEILEEWGQDNTLKLWNMLQARGGVSALRKERWTTTFLREFGHLSDKETDSSHAFLDDDGVLDAEAAATGPDPNSGWPSDMAEQAVELLQAGFIPRNCKLLATLIKNLMKAEVSRMTKPLRIPVKRSAEAFAVPGMSHHAFGASSLELMIAQSSDFSGVLQPGQVFCRVSQPSSCGLVDAPTMADGVVRGPMIVRMMAF